MYVTTWRNSRRDGQSKCLSSTNICPLSFIASDVKFKFGRNEVTVTLRLGMAPLLVRKIGRVGIMQQLRPVSFIVTH